MLVKTVQFKDQIKRNLIVHKTSPLINQDHLTFLPLGFCYSVYFLKDNFLATISIVLLAFFTLSNKYISAP